MADPDHPRLTALAAHGDLPGTQIHIATAWIVRVVADPGQIPRTDPACGEHRDDRRIAPLTERPALARLLQRGKFFAGEYRHQLLRYLWAAQPGHRVRNLLLVRQPAEELLQCLELIAGIGVAVPGQQMNQPALHVVAGHLVPAGATGARDQVGGGEPGHRLRVGPDRLGGLGLGRQVQPERPDLGRERTGVQGLASPGARLRDGHRFSLFLRFRYGACICA